MFDSNTGTFAMRRFSAFVFVILAYFAAAVAEAQIGPPPAPPIPNPMTIGRGGTGVATGFNVDSYIVSGLAFTTPTSPISSVSIISSGGATCTDPVANLSGGTQQPGNATGNGAIVLTTTGTNPTKTITGATIGPSATATVTIASPAVVTDTANGLAENSALSFTTTGALPTGLVVGVVYYIKTRLSVNTYTLSATVGGAAINTTGTQSGTHTRVTTAGNYSWPPGIVVGGCTGQYKIDTLLNTTTMTTMTTAAGKMVVGGVLYDVPQYTHTYTTGVATCDYFNTATLMWLSVPNAAPDFCAASAPNVFMTIVVVGGNPSWPNGPGLDAPLQIYNVVQIPGFIPLGQRVACVWQQGCGVTTQQGRDYVCTVGVNPGVGGCAFKGRYFVFAGDDDNSQQPYSTSMDGGPQVVMVRVAPNRVPLPNDLHASFGVASQTTTSGNAVGMQTLQIVAVTVDPTAGAMQGGALIAGAHKDGGGGPLGFVEFTRGMAMCNAFDACAARKGADTITLSDRVNTDNNSPGVYIGPTKQWQNPAQGRLTLAGNTPVMVASVTGATTIYYTPFIGDRIQIRRGTNFTEKAFAQLSNITSNSATGKAGPAAVAATKNYDLFVWDDAGVLTLTRGGAWNTDTVRSATTENDLVMSEGIWLNLNAITNGPAAGYGTYVGTVGSNAGSTIDYIFGAASAGGTAGRFMVWNMYNRRPVESIVKDTTATWNVTSNAYEAVNASNANRFTFVRGFDEDGVGAVHSVSIQNTVSVSAIASIGLDAVNAPAANAQGGYISISGLSAATNVTSHYAGTPGLGLHFLQALQFGSGATSLWIGGGLQGFTIRLQQRRRPGSRRRGNDHPWRRKRRVFDSNRKLAANA